MKIWCFFIVCFFINCNAQNDKEHWFAPVFDGLPSTRIYFMLYLSTAEKTPFNVTVFSGNKPYQTGVLSRDEPLIVYLDKDDVATKKKEDVIKVLNKGVFVKADKKFLAQLRILRTDDNFGDPKDAEIITSKGREALGTDFMIANIPNSLEAQDLTFEASIIATEDNTVVKFLNVNPGLQFFGNGGVLNSQINLNKGESYIISGFADARKTNLTGLIGSEIVASKPISVTSGHNNGQYFNKLYQNTSDILLDQAVPIEKLGNEYIIVKGISPIISSMEEVLIIGTEDNTTISVNSKTNADIKINKGDYFILDKSSFQNDAIYLLGNKNFYTYQFFGAGTTPYKAFSSGGMILVPPLDCYFSRNIENIAYPNEIYSNEFKTKLNVITKKTALIKLNGVPLSSAISPNTIVGNDDWVYYIIPNIAEKINSISSTKGMYVQLIGGSTSVGYGASYSGFSKEPEIVISADKTCIPGVELSIDDDFDFYQWQLNGQDILGATSATYKPTEQGYYSCKVYNDSCVPIDIPKIYVFNCTNSIDLNYEICSILNIDLSKIHPGFDLTTFDLTTPPKFGKVTKKDEILTYELTDLKQKSDRFNYKICDTSGVCYDVKVNLKISGSFTDKKPIVVFLCSDQNSALLGLGGVYDSYQWSTGEISSTIHVSLGDYYVDLGKNNCISRQYFKVQPAQTFSLKNIKVLQDKAIIYTSDDSKTYLYSLDGATFQTSNEFGNLKSGNYTVYVKFADSNCEIVEGSFIIFNIPNLITPNSDGQNDVVDFSAFKNKKEVKLQIFNKYGKSVYKSGTDLIWTGKLNNRNLPTSTYWYILTFKDDISGEPTVYKGWILLNSR